MGVTPEEQEPLGPLSAWLRWTGAVLAALAGITLLGWATRAEVLTAVVPGLATMKPNTALGFLMTGGAFFLLGSPRAATHRFALPLGILVAALGWMTFAEYRLGWEGGFDALLFADRADPADGAHPMRMSEATAFGFALTGLALSLSPVRAAWAVVQALGLMVGTIAVTALVGYAYGVDALYQVEPFGSLALHTSGGFLLAAAGVVCTVPDRGIVSLLRGDTMGGLTARRILPLAVAVPFALGWLRILGTRASVFEAEFGTGLFVVASIVILAALVSGYAGWLNRAERRRDELEEQLRQSQKLEAIGQLAGGIAHDFNNQLSAILTSAELAAWEALPEKAAKEIDEIRKAAERGASLTRQLLIFARRNVVEPRRVEVNAQVRGMVGMLRRLIPESIELETRFEDGPTPVFMDVTQLEQLVMNLVVNARDALPNGGTIGVSVGRATVSPMDLDEALEPGPYVTIEVRDDGIGMSESVRSQIFEPFFTTKEAGRGTGLGLATCLSIVEEADGHIGVHSKRDVGTTFTVHLPALDADPRMPRAGWRPDQTEKRPTPGRGTILLVEDDDAVRGGTERLLSRLGYRILAAENGSAALSIVEEVGDVDLVITDLVMPGMSGPQVIEAVRVRVPDVPVLFVSGYADEAALTGLGTGEVEVLQKPVRFSELHERILALLDRDGSGRRDGVTPADLIPD